jgi:hypothetical protein
MRMLGAPMKNPLCRMKIKVPTLSQKAREAWGLLNYCFLETLLLYVGSDRGGCA